MTSTITDPAKAALLAEVVELQAHWEIVPKSNGPRVGRTDLMLKQSAFDAYRSKANEYGARYQSTYVPERAINTPHLLGIWCRSMQSLFAVAKSENCPVSVVEKAFRWADRVAERAKQPALPHSVPTTTAEAIQALAGISLWCASASTAATPAEAA